MGWITRKRNTTGHGLAHGQKTSERKKAPLKMITALVKAGDWSRFGRGDRVKLECGHEVYSKGTYAARCRHCGKRQTV